MTILLCIWVLIVLRRIDQGLRRWCKDTSTLLQVTEAPQVIPESPAVPVEELSYGDARHGLFVVPRNKP
jgi:hypothetical protein